MSELHISLHVEPESDTSLHVDEVDDIGLTLAERFDAAGAPYEGSYDVYPSTSDQTLDTDGKKMLDDVTVHAVPLQEKNVTKANSGATVYEPDDGYMGLSKITVGSPASAITPSAVDEYATVGGVLKWRYKPQASATAGMAVGGTRYGSYETFDAIAATTVTPSTSQQTIGGPDTMMQGAITVDAMPTGSQGAASASREKRDGKLYTTVSFPNFQAGYVASLSPVMTSMTLESGTVTPTTSTQTVTPTDNSHYLDSVTVNPIPSQYIVPSGTYTVSSSGTKDVTSYASVSVAAGSVDVPNQSFTVTPSINVGSDGLISVSASGSKSVPAAVIEGWVSSGATGTVSVSGTNTQQLDVQAAATITPTTSAQTAVAAGKYTTGAVTVAAIPSEYVVPAGTKSISSNGTNIDVTNYAAVDVAVPSSSPSLQSKSKSYTPTTSQQSETVSADGGYDGLSSVAITVAAMPSGSVTAPSTITGSSATVSTGTNTLTLTKTVSVTPNVTTAGYVSSGIAGNSNVSLTASVTTQGAQTLYPSTSDQTITGSKYLTGTQTFKAVTTTNLTADNIKQGVTVQVGDSSDSDRVASVTGTYSGGGGSSMQVDFSESSTNVATSLSFSGLNGEPTSFSIVSATDISTGTPSKIAAIVFDGTNIHAQTITNTSNAQVSYDGSNLNKSYSNGTLTIVSTGAQFVTGQNYWMSYTYGGTAGNIQTEDVQVGSGATSIEFTGLEDEPLYWSCIFKSGFSTSSGYQRVIFVRYDGEVIEGMAMDSAARYSDGFWNYSYSSGSLTISSVGTNNGGYFHQPGYYQLTYAIDATGNYQSKTVTPTESQQVVQADSGYDALKKVTVNAIPSQYIVPTGNIAITSNTSGSNTLDVSQYATATVNVPTGGGSVQTATGTFTGNGTRTIDVSCDFEPDIVYFTSNPGTTASSGTVAAIIVRGMMTATRYRNNSTSNSHYAIPGIANMNTSGSSYSWRATYANSKVTLYCYSSNARALLTNGRTYTYTFVKYTS